MLYSCVASALGCIALSLVACARPAPSVADGESLYKANGCASCHGPSGRGDGPIAAKLSDRPIDLQNATLFQGGYGESEIAKTLAEGVYGAAAAADPHLHHTHHDLAMPKFDHLTDMERRSIALYVISLRKGVFSHDGK
jgi:mono/diheme cytochrome c family protein